VPPSPQTPAGDDAAALARIRQLHARDALCRAMGIAVSDGGLDRVTLTMEVQPEQLNFLGVVHGGVVFSFADAAMGFASNTHGNLSPAINAYITFAQACQAGDRLIARAQVLNHSPKLSNFESRVTREDGTLVALMSGTDYNSRRPLEL
jgi:acyl-CoA thioesterase